jgi:microsomal epoxide hydrolase
MSCQAFEIALSQATLDDLAARLADARLDPESADAADWQAGMSARALRGLVDYWRSGFDWRAQEARLNRHRQFCTSIDGTRVHFVHERGEGDEPLPLLLTHGFPDSFARFDKLIPMLTRPAAYGADAGDAFDVVAPSLPGYGFSGRPARGGIFHVGELWHTLMTDELGYRRFGAHGGDWGSIVTEHLGRSHAASVVGIHLTDVPFWHAFQWPDHPSAAEEAYLAANQAFATGVGAYAMIQGSRPQTLADGLNDSPVGLAAWIIEKFERWSDGAGDVERRFTKDELLTNVMIYWATETIGSSFLPYYDVTHASVLRWIVEKAKEWAHPSKVPAGFALFPKDLSRPPEEWARRFFDVRRWQVMPRGGHFAALEEPELLSREIREFFRPLRATSGRDLARARAA